MTQNISRFANIRLLLFGVVTVALPLLKAYSDPDPCTGTLKMTCPTHLTEFGTGASITMGGNLKDVKDTLEVEVNLNGDCGQSCYVVVTATYFNSADPNDPAVVDTRQVQIPPSSVLLKDINGLAGPKDGPPKVPGAVLGSDVVFEATVFCSGAVVRDIRGNPLTMKCSSKVKKAKEDKK